MALETFSFTAFVSLLLLLLPYLFQSILAHAVVQKQSPFHFIKHLQGCEKSDRMRGIHDLKKYLHRFGYLDHRHVVNSTKHEGDH